MTVSGASAVKDSKKAREQAETITLAEDKADDESTAMAKTVKKIGVKTFYLENGVWIDSDFKEEAKVSEIKVKAFSDEYFALVKADKEIAQYLSIGEEVVIIWKGKVYRLQSKT